MTQGVPPNSKHSTYILPHVTSLFITIIRSMCILFKHSASFEAVKEFIFSIVSAGTVLLPYFIHFTRDVQIPNSSHHSCCCRYYTESHHRRQLPSSSKLPTICRWCFFAITNLMLKSLSTNRCGCLGCRSITSTTLMGGFIECDVSKHVISVPLRPVIIAYSYLQSPIVLSKNMEAI